MNRLFNFVAGAVGPWRVEQAHCIAGAPLTAAPRLAVHAAPLLEPAPGAVWCLSGITSNERYVERSEKTQVPSLVGHSRTLTESGFARP